MFSGSVDACFVLALPFQHGDLEPDCVSFDEGGAYARHKNTSARLSTKNAGGAYARGGAYLRDTMILVSAHDHPSATIARLREAEVSEVMQHTINQTSTLLYLINRSITMYIVPSNTLQWCCMYLMYLCSADFFF